MARSVKRGLDYFSMDVHIRYDRQGKCWAMISPEAMAKGE